MVKEIEKTCLKRERGLPDWLSRTWGRPFKGAGVLRRAGVDTEQKKWEKLTNCGLEKSETVKGTLNFKTKVGTGT